jgi:hypothetical protein
MHKTLLAAAAGLGALVLALPASAASTITFNEFTTRVGNNGIGTRFESGGFSFDYTGSSQFWVFGNSLNADRGGATIRAGDRGVTTVRKLDGARFDLLSLDFADQNNWGQSGAVEFTFFDGTDVTTDTFTLDNLVGLETAFFNRTNLVWFSFHATQLTSPQFDNMTWAESAVSAVPEPASWALMITGFAGAGIAIRNRRRRDTALVAL